MYIYIYIHPIPCGPLLQKTNPMRHLRYIFPPHLNPSCPKSLLIHCWPRLAIAMVLQGAWSQICCFFGTCCSSFVAINQGTSCRSALVPEGCERVPSVRVGNKLLCRTGLRGVCACVQACLHCIIPPVRDLQCPAGQFY